MTKRCNKNKTACSFAYERAEISGMTGEVDFCCPNFLVIPVGNIQEQDFQSIWNGENARKIRKAMLEGNFQYCHTDICDYSPISSKVKNEYAPLPKMVEIAPSSICNVRCVMCRDKHVLFPAETEKGFYKKMQPKYLEALENADFLNLNQCGEALVDKHCRDLIREAVKINPKLKINILTNGLKCDKKTFESYDIYNRVESVQISIHATTEETYNKVVRDSNFNKVKKNLEWLASEKQRGNINEVRMNFVVMSYNFREMIDYAKWAEKLNVLCDFWEVRQHPDIELDKDPATVTNGSPKMLYNKYFHEIAVFLPQHPEYEDLVKILKNPIFKKDFVNINPFLSNLKSQKAKKTKPTE